MKKLFIIPILILTLFAYVNNVKADSIFNIDYDISNIAPSSDMSYSDIKNYYNSKAEIFNLVMNNFMSSYSSYSETYPYYRLQIFASSNQIQFDFWLNSSIPVISSLKNVDYYIPYEALTSCIYSLTSNSFTGNSDCSSISTNSSSIYLYSSDSSSGELLSNRIFFSNYELKFSNPTNLEISYTVDYGSVYRSWLSSDNDIIPTAYNFLELSFFDNYIPSDYVEVNLNSYDYVILTLKDYQQPKFTSIIQVQGSLCITPVYNYGMTPKADYFENYKTQACTLYYDTFTPTPLYILSSDLQNNAVYYIKSPDNSTTNKIKYDSSKFNLFTFNSQTGSEPSIIINGRTYSPIPYSDLTDTAIISTDEGYISGEVCAIGDIECSASATGIDISNLFTHPLELLETLWGSITAVFTTITTFITILPPTLQTFLYVSFMLIIILGILKYLLG